MIKSINYTGFFIYIIFIIIIIYIETKYNLEDFLLIGILIISYFYFNRLNPLLNASNLRKINRLVYFYSFIFIIIYFLFYNIISLMIFGEEEVFPYYLQQPFIYYIKALLIFPFLEELIFRRSLLRLLLVNYSAKKAIILSSFGFALCHYFSNTALFYTFLGSLFFGYLYLKYRNIWICFIMHSLHNLLVIIICFLLSMASAFGISFLNSSISFLVGSRFCL